MHSSTINRVVPRSIASSFHVRNRLSIGAELANVSGTLIRAHLGDETPAEFGFKIGEAFFGEFVRVALVPSEMLDVDVFAGGPRPFVGRANGADPKPVGVRTALDDVVYGDERIDRIDSFVGR